MTQIAGDSTSAWKRFYPIIQLEMEDLMCWLASRLSFCLLMTVTWPACAAPPH
jgi:hypothetical protein